MIFRPLSQAPESSEAKSVLSGLDRFLQETSGRAASGINRRKFLGGVGAAAAGLVTAGVSAWPSWSPAYAEGSCSHACGPSNYCNSSDCNFDNPSQGYCNVIPRIYGTYTCTNGSGNVWYECYCGGGCSSQGVVGCHDCCGENNVGSGSCNGGYYGVCGLYYNCICKGQVANCPVTCSYCEVRVNC